MLDTKMGTTTTQSFYGNTTDTIQPGVRLSIYETTKRVNCAKRQYRDALQGLEEISETEHRRRNELEVERSGALLVSQDILPGC